MIPVRYGEGGLHARTGWAYGFDVQLCRFGRTRSRQSPAPQNPRVRKCRAGGARCGVRHARPMAVPRLHPSGCCAALIQILFSVRSERQLMEQMQYNLLFRWFVGLGIDDPVWVPTVFTKNRDRLLNADVARQFLAAI